MTPETNICVQESSSMPFCGKFPKSEFVCTGVTKDQGNKQFGLRVEYLPEETFFI